MMIGTTKLSNNGNMLSHIQLRGHLFGGKTWNVHIYHMIFIKDCLGFFSSEKLITKPLSEKRLFPDSLVVISLSKL